MWLRHCTLLRNKILCGGNTWIGFLSNKHYERERERVRVWGPLQNWMIGPNPFLTQALNLKRSKWTVALQNSWSFAGHRPIQSPVERERKQSKESEKNKFEYGNKRECSRKTQILTSSSDFQLNKNPNTRKQSLFNLKMKKNYQPAMRIVMQRCAGTLTIRQMPFCASSWDDDLSKLMNFSRIVGFMLTKDMKSEVTLCQSIASSFKPRTLYWLATCARAWTIGPSISSSNNLDEHHQHWPCSRKPPSNYWVWVSAGQLSSHFWPKKCK